ncbi:MAG: HDOD domain-containing protein [Gammaproteobacteria bacterium]|nr:HDOD domain-containing protein [Gammaproteobacteria bacterium]MCW8987247.1 HDOD domain-containing protein [Gammaproteobacteria bacterium]MCW9032451.1 HDOD domain-containing protein [Gammaproteobacteria bacterium]
MNEQKPKATNLTAKELVTGSIRLVSLPEVCIRVNEMLDDPSVTAAELGQIISQDTSLTARLLKIVNSSYYGFQAKIETVSRAVTVVGLRELRGLVIAASAVETFSNISDEVLNKVRFWRHSLYCGVIARLLAEQCHVLHSERLFVAGLLHDIGKLIIAQRLPQETRMIALEADSAQRPEFEVEQDLLGFNHAEVGGELMHAWNMPETLFESVAYHHSPKHAEVGIMETYLVHMANIFTDEAEQGLDMLNDKPLQKVDPYAWEITGLDESVKDLVFREAGPLFTEALETILPRSYPSY